jgi:hypothetical protein
VLNTVKLNGSNRLLVHYNCEIESKGHWPLAITNWVFLLEWNTGLCEALPDHIVPPRVAANSASTSRHMNVWELLEWAVVRADNRDRSGAVDVQTLGIAIVVSVSFSGPLDELGCVN